MRLIIAMRFEADRAVAGQANAFLADHESFWNCMASSVEDDRAEPLPHAEDSLIGTIAPTDRTGGPAGSTARLASNIEVSA